MRFEPTIDGNLRRNFEILLALCAATLAITKVKPLIYLDIQDRQMPKVLVPCPGGHGIAFVYPSIPCLEAVSLSLGGLLARQAETGNQHLKFDMKKNMSRVMAKRPVEVRNNAY
jgi:hypothetical protein